MWTVENRGRYDRSKLRYPSDLTDAEWFLVKPLIPRAKRGGNKRTVNVRDLVDGLMYVLSTGCQWTAIPKDLPPRSTVNGYFKRWQHDRTLDRLHHALYVACREQAGCDASPTAAVVTRRRVPDIDSQSVKSAEKATVLSVKRRFDFSSSDTGRSGSRLSLRDTAFGGFDLDPLRPVSALASVASDAALKCFAMVPFS